MIEILIFDFFELDHCGGVRSILNGVICILGLVGREACFG
jgi:hypothetical protein